MEIIDMTISPIPFNPGAFFGSGYKLVEEPIRDQGLDDLDVDVNFANVDYITGQTENERITCEEELARLREVPNYLLLGAGIAYGLLKNYEAKRERSVLEYLRAEKGVRCIDFLGDVVQDCAGGLNIIRLVYDDRNIFKEEGEWKLMLCGLSKDFFKGYVAALAIP